MLFSSRVKARMTVKIRFSVLVSCNTHVFVLVSTVIVTLPYIGLDFCFTCSFVVLVSYSIDLH